MKRAQSDTYRSLFNKSDNVNEDKILNEDWCLLVHNSVYYSMSRRRRAVTNQMSTVNVKAVLDTLNTFRGQVYPPAANMRYMVCDYMYNVYSNNELTFICRRTTINVVSNRVTPLIFVFINSLLQTMSIYMYKNIENTKTSI